MENLGCGATFEDLIIDENFLAPGLQGRQGVRLLWPDEGGRVSHC